ncbi:cyclic nucleotide-binding domain-containing protein [uncultured Tateyamaria sp.]|uniref:Crp/Fnr family transcriptional regulator n=1 Tax=uncultured Tateyamaria sp. TaxID=455651 RepID=UPI0026051137|nr:cyclic nucleotide-binding domain-containing protein [uncultured Tateyamaria sp.]
MAIARNPFGSPRTDQSENCYTDTKSHVYPFPFVPHYRVTVELRMISIMSAWIKIIENAPVQDLAKRDLLFRRDDPVQSMFLVKKGLIALERPLSDGGLLTLHLTGSGTALAEASMFAKTYRCDAAARSDASVAFVRRDDFEAALRRSSDAAMSLIETHAKAVQSQRARIEILRLRRVSDRLDACLDIHGEVQKETGSRSPSKLAYQHLRSIVNWRDGVSRHSPSRSILLGPGSFLTFAACSSNERGQR